MTDVTIPIGERRLDATLALAEGARALIVFAHGSGSGRHSPRNRRVADQLNERRFATLLLDLLTPEEDAEDRVTAQLRFDISLLAERLVAATDWANARQDVKDLAVCYFGASTGAAAAIVAAAERPAVVRAVVSRGGRPDLAGDALEGLRAPLLLIVGENDEYVMQLNRAAMHRVRAEVALSIVPGAGHLFEEPGALDAVAHLAGAWFERYL